MSKLILLGAGASYGSKHATPSVPPLGPNLFRELETTGGIFSTLSDDLKAAFRSDFETGMGLYFDHSNRNVMRFQRELSAYFAQFQPGEDSEYVRLVRQIGTQHYIYCSLNYDLLLEQSAALLGFDTRYAIQPHPREIRVLKLHGSCNFWPNFLGVMKGVHFEGNGADIEAPVRPLDREQTLDACRTEDSLSPAIAMYAKGKGTMVCPRFVQEQQRMWKHALSMASRVYVSGVRVVPEDTHVWNEMAQSNARVTYFGFQGDHDAFQDWKVSHGKKNAFFVESDFSGCIEMIASDI